MKSMSQINLKPVSASQVLSDLLELNLNNDELRAESSYASHTLRHSLNALSQNLNQLDEMTSKLGFLNREIRYVLKK